jgi:signal peptidase I
MLVAAQMNVKNESVSLYLFLALLVAVYLLINLALPAIAMNSLIKAYLIQPVLWGTLILTVRFLPEYNPLGKISKRGAFIQLGLGLAGVQILFYFVGGLFSGFGKSPSSFTPLGIVENIFFVGSMLIGMELSRAWLVNRFGKKHSFLIITIATLLFTFMSIPFAQVTGFQLEIGSSNQVISSWLPLLAEDLAASLLVLTGGAGASLAYRALLAAFWWLCPILPNLDWALKGLIGTVVPVIGMVVINNFYSSQAARVKSRKRVKNSSLPAGWIMTAITCVGIVWFATGVLPVKPYLVPSGSMVPVINPGDVVLTVPVQPSVIKVGDIIEYRNKQENINIVHRVIAIGGSTQNLSFIFKGDANDSPDANAVSPQQIMGRVVVIVPKIGWISIEVKKLLTG